MRIQIHNTALNPPISFIGSYIYGMGYCPGGRIYSFIKREDTGFILLP
jgi:hypothetical protein